MPDATADRWCAVSQDEPVANTSHGLQVSRLPWVWLDMFTEPTYVDINGARVHRHLIAPDTLKQEIAAMDHAGMPCHEEEQVELLWPEFQRPSIPFGFVLCLIDAQRALRRNIAFTRAVNSRIENGFVM